MITAIIPAYNEASRIEKAIQALRSSFLVSEIIVVDDGSSDGTDTRAKALGVRVITIPKNSGKGNAMNEGVLNAKNEIILFCDADMYGFSEKGIEKVVNPILKGESDMTIGLRPVVTLAKCIFPFLILTSGFRAILKDRWRQVSPSIISGYQVELALNSIAKKNDWKILYATVPGLSHTIKEMKYGILNGLVARSMMFRDMFFVTRKLRSQKRRGSDKNF